MTTPPPARTEPRAADAREQPRRCPRCAAPMEDRKCKVICLNCGAYDDCSDP